MLYIKASSRQSAIFDIIQAFGPITGEKIAEKLSLSRAALRSDLAVLTMSGYISAKPKVGYYVNDRQESPAPLTQLSTIQIAGHHSPSVVIRETCSVYDAIVTMFLEDVGTLFVVTADNILEGALSRKDLLKITMGNKSINDLPVSIIMTRMPNIIVTTPEETVLEAALKLLEHEIDALPVVQPKGGDEKKLYVVGRFTKTNITRLFLQLAGK